MVDELELGLRKFNSADFYVERITKFSYALTKVRRLVHRRRSKYQLIEVVDTYDYGLALYLDNALQVTEYDEYIYHEVMVHPAMLAHPSPKKVLVIGGGDGGVAREVLKHKDVERVDVVEIDRDVVEVVMKYMPSVPSGAFNDPRCNLIIEDGKEYVKRTEEKYDVVFMDVTDDVGPATELFTSGFLKMVKRVMEEQGILIIQALGSLEHEMKAKEIARWVGSIFKNAGFYGIYVPSFTDRWNFVYGSDAYDILNMDVDVIRKRFIERRLTTKFYDPDVHLALKALSSKGV